MGSMFNLDRFGDKNCILVVEGRSEEIQSYRLHWRRVGDGHFAEVFAPWRVAPGKNSSLKCLCPVAGIQ
jgi:hypothetical protein